MMTTSAWTVGTRPSGWILCRDAVRPIVGGEVFCPIVRKPIGLAACPTCRWLEDADDDRFAAWTCSSEPSGPGEPTVRSDDAEDVTASLLIELL